ncbi:integration host factor, actinobacterial type [Adlercreutzia sp. ZJ141]|uniref:integration host factor, actinobacterial type n=1 Tax=Adlercreutzia sp. ZJ141 TaxID=2709406 RepID=UPI0013EB75F6|nr:integration host factor, actinobacterial type [Adlercreutzia sp. ZJ141]
MIPVLSSADRRQNLEKGLKLRHRRAEIRKDLGNGIMNAYDVIMLADRGDQAASGMRVKHLISAHPGYGTVKTRELMDMIGIADNRRVGGLSVRQARSLIEKLDGVAL